MAMNVNRWLKYAKARLDSAVGSGHESLDRLEAEQEAKRADKPWLASDSVAPTFDEARARIAWEADQQAKKADRHREAAEAEARDTGTDVKEPGAKGEEARGSSPAEGRAQETDVNEPGAESSDDVDAPHRRKTDTDASDTTEPDAGPAPRSPQQVADDAERETARLELEDRQRKSAERLDQIRQELGIEDTPNP